MDQSIESIRTNFVYKSHFTQRTQISILSRPSSSEQNKNNLHVIVDLCPILYKTPNIESIEQLIYTLPTTFFFYIHNNLLDSLLDVSRD